VRRLVGFVATLLAGALLGLVTTGLWLASRGTQPEPWHRLRPASEFTAARAGEVPDLAAYRSLEDRVFEETRTELARRASRFPPYSRFDPASPTHPSHFDRDWNRTYELAPQGELAGEALLLHGLSDSPHSLRAVGQLLSARGFHVVGLRIPGHGAVPGGLTAASFEDWRAAVRIGAAATGGRAESVSRPFVVVGYSNGAALALDFTLSALGSGSDRVPDRLVFLSPAFAVSPAAALARWPERLSRLPGLAKLAWSSIEMEFDPFKFNSFPVRAGAEIHDLTETIETRLAALGEARDGARLPPILSLQSVVDATVPPVASLTRLFSRVRSDDGTTELVLFDANRAERIGPLLGPAVDELLSLASAGRAFPFRLSLVTNAGTGTAAVEEVSRAAGSLEATRTPLPLAWPAGVYSLSHVAIPFPPDDPAYGFGDSPVGPPFPFGALALKGERGALLIPDSLLTRIRCNPFFPVVERKIVEFVAGAERPAADPVQASGTTPLN